MMRTIATIAATVRGAWENVRDGGARPWQRPLMSATVPSVRYRIGVDENGLGPRLGPMVVTALLARVTDDGFRIASRKPRGALARRLGDSKELVAHGDVALGEAWARAL